MEYYLDTLPVRGKCFNITTLLSRRETAPQQQQEQQQQQRIVTLKLRLTDATDREWNFKIETANNTDLAEKITQIFRAQVIAVEPKEQIREGLIEGKLCSIGEDRQSDHNESQFDNMEQRVHTL